MRGGSYTATAPGWVKGAEILFFLDDLFDDFFDDFLAEAVPRAAVGSSNSGDGGSKEVTAPGSVAGTVVRFVFFRFVLSDLLSRADRFGGYPSPWSSFILTDAFHGRRMSDFVVCES
jgi:hypothetical protein